MYSISVWGSSFCSTLFDGFVFKSHDRLVRFASIIIRLNFTVGGRKTIYIYTRTDEYDNVKILSYYCIYSGASL